MAAQKSQRSRTRSRSTSSRNGSRARSASEKTEKYRFAKNVEGEATVAEQIYRDYAEEARKGSGIDPDVLIDVPVVKVDSLHLELDDLQAHVALQAKVLELVNLNVGVDVSLGKVALDIKGVEAQAVLKVRLDHVTAIVDRVLTTVDRNPELVESIGRAVADIGEGAGHTLGESGEAVEDIGEGTGDAVGQVGAGAGQAVEGVGEGAGQAAGNLDQVLANTGQAVGRAGGGVGQAAGALGGGGGGLGDVAGLLTGDHSTRAKEAAKLTVKELGVSAKEKVKEIGERRRHRKAEEHDATDRAYELADELGVDLEAVDGTGADGRITVRDVERAARE